jgi:putative ATPase
MKHYGFGVGYRYPHDYEGADVDQQYLPDELVERRYYRPSEQGYEATIGSRMDARRAAREGGPRKRASNDRGPEVAGMREAGRIMRTRESNRAKLAESEKKDASE